MLDSDGIAVLDRLLELTRQGRLVWESAPDLDFSAVLGDDGRRVIIQRLWMEVVGRAGADPYFVEVNMPGWITRFPIAGDSDGWRRVCAILDAAFPEGWASMPRRALEYLNTRFPQESERHAEPGAAPDPAARFVSGSS